MPLNTVTALLGADGAFEKYARTAFPQLVRAARLLGVDPADAEDVAQDALVIVCTRWSHIRDKGAVDAYAYRCLVRGTRRHLRRAGLRRQRLKYVTPPEAVASDDGSFQEDAVHAAVNTLPRRQREIVILRFFCDLSVRDVARLLSCTEGTIKSQTSKAMHQLKSILVGSIRENL